ncbi:MAG: hypothetical protein ABL928_10950 [Sphingorhabdus sp.]
MKQFFSKLSISIISGMALLLIGFSINNWLNSSLRKVDYQINTAATSFSKEELDAVLKMAKSKKSYAKIALITVENSGEKTLKNVEFTIRPTISDDPSKFYGFGLAATDGGEMLSPSMIGYGADIDVKFPILRPEQSATLWIAHVPPQDFQIINKNDDIEFHEDLSFLGPVSDGFDWIDYLLAFLIIFAFGAIAGAILGDKVNKEMLTKAGYSPAEVEAAYLRAQADDKVRKE